MEERREEGTEGKTVCARCGRSADGTPVAWACSMENGDPRYFCEGCSRENILAIEGRLDPSQW